MDVRDRVVVVTGASAGIGRRTALLLARKGARVIAAARNEERLRELERAHAGITAVACDVTDPAGRARLVNAAGDADVLVNNAGIGRYELVEDMAMEDIRYLYELNVLAPIELTKAFLPGMLERGLGHVVNVASIAGYVSTPPISVYSSTKAALQSFGEGLRRELHGRGVTVATINPGPIATEFGDRAAGGDPNATGRPPKAGRGAELVARAVYRSIVLRGIPGYQDIAVPRVVGVSRAGALPGVARALDLTGRVARTAVLNRLR